MRYFILSLPVVSAVLSAVAASADSSFWTDREICRAAVKTYFFLRTKPADATDSDGLYGFRSAAGYTYACRIDETRVEFQWLNASGTALSSDSTTFSVLDNVLTIRTDMRDERFSVE